MGEYAAKMSEEFGYGPYRNPGYKDPDVASGEQPWYGDIGNILDIKKNLHCRDFSWFLWRFGIVYLEGGLVPEYTFTLRWDDATEVKDSKTDVVQTNNFQHDQSLAIDGFGSIFAREKMVNATKTEDLSATGKYTKKHKCLAYLRGPGTSGDGRGHVGLRTCDKNDDRQKFHWANKPKFAGMRGIRAWNTDQCFDDVAVGGSKKISTYVCDVAGEAMAQQWYLTFSDNIFTKTFTASHTKPHHKQTNQCRQDYF